MSFLSAPLKSTAQKRLIVIAGQSTAVGRCTAANVTNYPGIANPYLSVLQYSQIALLADPPTWVTESWRALQPRSLSDSGSYPVGSCGVELSMGRTLDAAGVATWYIAKLAIDSSSLQRNWISATYPTSGEKLQAYFADFITARLAETGALLTGIVWIQGQADAAQSPDNVNYLTNLGTLFSGLQAKFGTGWGTFIHRITNTNAGISYQTIRSAEESYAAANPNCYISVGDDLGLNVDGAHYDDNGHVTLGIRIGEDVLDFVASTPIQYPRWQAGGVPVVASSAQSATPAWPSHEAGDVAFMLLTGIGNNNYPLSVPAGFVEMPNSPQHDGVAGDVRLHIWWCRATSNAMPSPTIADVASDDFKSAVIITVRGCTPTGIPYAATSGGTAPSSTAVTIPGASAMVAGSLLLVAVAHTSIGSSVAQSTGWANASVTDLTEQVDYVAGSGVFPGLSIATARIPSIGPYNATTATLLTASTQAFATVELRA